MRKFLLFIACSFLSSNYAHTTLASTSSDLEMSQGIETEFGFDEEYFDLHAGHCDPHYSPLTLEFTATFVEIGLPVASDVTLTFTSYAIDRKGNFFTGAPVTLDFPLVPSAGLALSPVIVKRPLIGNYTVGYFVTVSAGAFAETTGLLLSGGLFGTIGSRVEYVPIPAVLAPYAILNVAAVNVSYNYAFRKPLRF